MLRPLFGFGPPDSFRGVLEPCSKEGGIFILAHTSSFFSHLQQILSVAMAAIASASSAVVARPAFVGKTESLRVRAAAPAKARASVAVFASADAEATSRRAALSLFSVSARGGDGRR